MSQSSLVNRQWWANSSNYSVGRMDTIHGIVIHHAASTSLDSVGATFAQYGRGGSAHYGVKDGTIHQYVREEDTAWHCLPVDVTEVMTPFGFVPLSELRVGDPVYQWDKDSKCISETTVQRVIAPRGETVFRMRETEATAEHKIAYHTYDNAEIKLAKWGERLNTQTYFPDDFVYFGNGVDLSDDQIKFLVAVQADGHYIKDTDQVRFHFRKERKIARMEEILANLQADYRVYRQKTGIVFVVKNAVNFCEQYLEDKQFSYRLLDMSRSQMEVFAEELPRWDGSITDRTTFYCTSNAMSAEVVQMALFLSGRQTYVSEVENFGKKVSYRITLPINNKYMFDKKTETTSRETVVSCISVPSGFIIIRQYGRTQIIGNCGDWAGNSCTIGIETVNSTGAPDWLVNDPTFEKLAYLCADIAARNNLGMVKFEPNGTYPTLSAHRDWSPTYCPGDYLYGKMYELQDKINAINYPAKAKLKWKELKPITIYLADKEPTILYDFNHTHAENVKKVKEFKKGTEFEIKGECVNETIGKSYLVTTYSFDNKKTNGFNVGDLVAKAPDPDPDPPTPDPPSPDPDPDPTVNILKKILEFIQHIIDLITKKQGE